MKLPLQRLPPFHILSADLPLGGFVHSSRPARPLYCLPSCLPISPTPCSHPHPHPHCPNSPSLSRAAWLPSQGAPSQASTSPPTGPEKPGDQRAQQQGQVSILLHRPQLIKRPDSQGDQTRPPASCWLKLAFKLPSLNLLSLSPC